MEEGRFLWVKVGYYGGRQISVGQGGLVQEKADFCGAR